MTRSPGTFGRLKPAPSVHTRRFDDEFIVLDLARGEYLALDAIGSELWDALASGGTIEDVARRVVAEYDVSLEQARADLTALADDFVTRGLFVAEGDPR